MTIAHSGVSRTSQFTVPTSPFLYAITHGSHLHQVRALLDGGVRVIQLREKKLPWQALTEIAARGQELCAERGAQLFINDYLELALATPGAGLHVGQGDLSVAEARAALGPERPLGVSTHNDEQFEAAVVSSADYIAVGPVFPTGTKENPDPVVGLEFVSRCWKRLQATDKRLVCIGGITIDRIPQVLAAAPTAGIAMISALVGQPDIAAAARSALEMMGGDSNTRPRRPS